MVTRRISVGYHSSDLTDHTLLRPFGRILRPLVALAITIYVLLRARPSAVLASAAGADLRWIGAAIALVIVDRALMAYRWIALLCTLEGPRPPMGALMRVFFESTFLGTFLPASVGGDAARAYQLARLDVPLGIAVGSVLMDRLLGVVSILIMGVVGLALSRGDVGSTRAIQLSLLVAGGISVGALLVVFSDQAALLARRVSEAMPWPGLRRLGVGLTGATRAYARHHRVLGFVLAGSIGVQVLRIVQAYCLGLGLHIATPLDTYFAFVPLILLVMLLPVSINGIGPSQAAFVWFFSRAGVAEADAFALSVLFVALGIVGNLPGGLLYATGQGQRDRKSPVTSHK